MNPERMSDSKAQLTMSEGISNGGHDGVQRFVQALYYNDSLWQKNCDITHDDDDQNNPLGLS